MIRPFFLFGSVPRAFRLLLLGQGYRRPEDLCAAVFAAWRGILARGPFAPERSSWPMYHRVIPYFDDGDPTPVDDLKVQQNGSVLSIDPSDRGLLPAYLAKQKQIALDDFTRADASDLWPVFGGGGLGGSLVAILVNGTTPGELYEFNSAYPVPVVAAVTAGDLWPMVLARGVGQLLAGLADEYELPGAQFEQPPPGAILEAPNVIMLDSAQSTALAAGAKAQTVIPDVIKRWPVHKQDTLAYHPNPGPPGQPSPPHPAVGGVQLVEGGLGFRRNVVRGDWDCLMRRQPYEPTRPIQADVGFCKVCTTILQDAATGRREVQYGRRVHLGSQRLLFDEVAWTNRAVTVVASLGTQTLTHGTPGITKPRWSCDVTVSDTMGLSISNLKLFDRPDDPFAAAADVMKSINFTDLSITVGTEPLTPLTIADAFSPPEGVPAPELEIAHGGAGDPECNIGVKLTLWWRIPSGWDVEAAMSLVLRGMKNDIDPGGVAMACKLFPQLSIRYRRPKHAMGTLPKVAAVHGTIIYVANNTAPTMAGMGDGTLGVGLFVDSNTARYDKYQLGPGGLGPTVRIFPPLISINQSLTWTGGRKLARVEALGSAVGGTTLAAAARVGYRLRLAPIVPLWSWLFDYAFPLFKEAGTTAKPPFVAVYASHELTGAGKPAGRPRDVPTPYPSRGLDGTSRDYLMGIRKMGRQGAYDNVHASLDMGTDDVGRPVASAPFCADKCLHLHWRWGVEASDGYGVIGPEHFRGWGPGRLALGAGTVFGAPLIPPNQHLDVTVEQLTPAEARVTYSVKAYDPGQDERQVLLEQGISFAFSYEGNIGLLTPFGGAKGLAATVGVPPQTVLANLRDTFAAIYPQLRWFDNAIDGVGNLEQVPGPASGLLATLEDA